MQSRLHLHPARLSKETIGTAHGAFVLMTGANALGNQWNAGCTQLVCHTAAIMWGKGESLDAGSVAEYCDFLGK